MISDYVKSQRCPQDVRDRLNDIQDDLKSFQKGDIENTIEKQSRKQLKDITQKYESYSEVVKVTAKMTKYGIASIRYEGGFDKVFLFDRKGNLTDYIEGNVKELPKTNKYEIDGTGISIKFYPNGYPASYKSIVKNRLFGRQIEWNDKGEVVSDVDLDIPTIWANELKKIDLPKTWTDAMKEAEKDK
ncbi:MAG: hypothetical protein LBQ66_13520 [Planctomycetaceae bacterium]|nr:hypothetical protein [Planctomycetaceae bacterium]